MLNRMMVKYRTVKPRNKCKCWKLLGAARNRPKLSDVVNIIQYQFLIVDNTVNFPPTHNTIGIQNMFCCTGGGWNRGFGGEP